MTILGLDEIKKLGFKSYGKNIRISSKASFYNSEYISLGSNVRIDDFCVLSAGEGGIVIGDYVHIAVASTLMGAGSITLSDFCGLSARVAIYSSSDDYSGMHLTNPTVPNKYTCVTCADVHLGRHVIVGSGSVILPGVRLAEGVAVGVLSLVKNDCAAFGIYAGTPARRIKERSRNLLEVEKLLYKSIDF